VIAGEKFNKLTVVEFLRYGRRGGVWLFICDCGKQREGVEVDVKHGSVKSCGCLKIERIRQTKTKHGQSSHDGPNGRSIEYTCWLNLRRRCLELSNPVYANYGARGIKVCDRWHDSFENFFADVGRKPTPEHSLDRINNDGNYEPGNVRWATRSEQAFNRRPKKAEKSACG
jgi:hypothetical protein